MGEYFLKNPTPSVIRIDDLGYEIASNQSVTIDENDFDGFLTIQFLNIISLPFQCIYCVFCILYIIYNISLGYCMIILKISQHKKHKKRNCISTASK